MSESRLEGIVHVVVAKPIAWTLYGLWQAVKWIGRRVATFGTWAQNRWAEYRQKKEASRTAAA